MRVLRHRTYLGCFAVFVFAMQLVLAFAQTHTHSLARTGLDRLASRAITYGMCRPNTEKPCPAPARRDDHSKCQLCVSMAMASTGVLQAPPVILPRQPVIAVPGPVRAVALVDDAPFRHFQARAPPLA